MKIRIKKKHLENGIIASLFIALAVMIFLSGATLTTNQVLGATNITNNSVMARVNITNTEPNITRVTVDDSTLVPANLIDLVANSVRVVTCNITITDFNGANDIAADMVNATFHIASVGRDGDTDNNHRYRNESCGSCRQATSTEAAQFGKQDVEVTICDCKFAVQYYANDSNQWKCNASITDRGGTGKPGEALNFTDSEASNTTTVTGLLAINTTDIIDYGNLSVTQTSPEIPFNVSNGGNIKINLTLRGYGGYNESGDYPDGINSTMVCQFGNISVGNQRYFLGDGNSGVPFDSMINLTNKTRRTNLTLPERVNDTNFGFAQNTTIWKLAVPLSVGGLCNGTVIFGAIAS